MPQGSPQRSGLRVCLTYFVSGRMTLDAEDAQGLQEERDRMYKHRREEKEDVDGETEALRLSGSGAVIVQAA